MVSVCDWRAWNDGGIPSTCNDGTSPFVVIVSFMPFIVIRTFELLSRLGWVPFMTSNILLRLTISFSLLYENLSLNYTEFSFTSDVLCFFSIWCWCETFYIQPDTFWDTNVYRCPVFDKSYLKHVCWFVSNTFCVSEARFCVWHL